MTTTKTKISAARRALRHHPRRTTPFRDFWGHTHTHTHLDTTTTTTTNRIVDEMLILLPSALPYRVIPLGYWSNFRPGTTHTHSHTHTRTHEKKNAASQHVESMSSVSIGGRSSFLVFSLKKKTLTDFFSASGCCCWWYSCSV